MRREISSALYDRDEALKVCNELRQKFGDYSEGANRDCKNRPELHSYNREHGSASKEAEKENSTRDHAKRDKERMDNLDQANLELDKLRKFVDTLQGELEEAVQEAEVSKRRRDWAFSERDKIVLERESIRTLCDRLQKERDRAITELHRALRDSDEIKKQRGEALKELKELKEKLESGDAHRGGIRTGGGSILGQYGRLASHVHDSAIETEHSEWEVLAVHLDLGRLCPETERDLGLVLVNANDGSGSGLHVAQVNQGSLCDGKLQVNDCILKVNATSCRSARTMIEAMRSCCAGVSPVALTVKRRRLCRRSLRTTQLAVGSLPHGIILETGIYIGKISPGSLAAKDGYLTVGDRVLNVSADNYYHWKGVQLQLDLLVSQMR